MSYIYRLKNEKDLIKKIVIKLLTHPIRYLKIVFLKAIIYPFKYKIGNDYNAEEYWQDRFMKYGDNIRGPGDEGASEKENKKRYERVLNIFKELCKQFIIDFKHMKILEIGTGTGLITNAIYELGVQHYNGIDITDIIFPMLRKRYKTYNFVKLDITTDYIEGKYDLIVIIDVIEHIVKREKFEFAMNNIKFCLAEGGALIIAPLVEKNFKAQFY